MKPAYTVRGVKARCTSCKKVYTPSAAQIEEAQSFGCLMSPCCSAPATVEQVTVTKRSAQ